MAEKKIERDSIGYLGLPGSWSHQVAQECFGSSADLQGLEAADLLNGYVSGDLARVCIPYYSSIAGPTPYLPGFLGLQGLWIAQDVVRPVQHSLATCVPNLALEDIRHLTGHPVAFKEVEPWLEQNLPNVPWSLAPSGSQAAKTVADLNEPSHAAITPPQAAQAHGLHMLLADIPPAAPNVTRWWVLGPVATQSPGSASRVWLRVCASNRLALCELETAWHNKGDEAALLLYTPSDSPELAHNLVVCLRQEDLSAFQVLASAHRLAATLMGAHDGPVQRLVSSYQGALSACHDQAQVR